MQKFITVKKYHKFSIKCYKAFSKVIIFSVILTRNSALQRVCYSGKCKIEFESYQFSQVYNKQSYIAKFVMLTNFKVNFIKEEVVLRRKID